MTAHISCAICGSVARPNPNRDEGFGICDLCWYADELPLSSETYLFDLERAAQIHDHVGDFEVDV